MKKIDLSSPMHRDLRSGYLNYKTKTLVQVLEKFCASPEGADAGVMLLLPEGRNPMQKEFNIKEIRLVENKIVGAQEKYRCMILVE